MIRNTRRALAIGLGIAALALTAAAAPAKAEKKAEVGKAAPAFELKDLNGKSHKLSDFKNKIVVLEWTNPECPYIKGVYDAKNNGTVKATTDAIAKMNNEVVYLAIDSSANRTEEQVIKRNKDFFKKHGAKHPVLIDHSGTVGRTYGAKSTPHMFVIDGKGVLRYHGAFTNDSRGRLGETRYNYVLNAVNVIREGGTIQPTYMQQWGCSVKYAG